MNFPGGRDSVAVFAELESISFQVQDPAVPLHENEILYVGREPGIESSILMNFDFSELSAVDLDTNQVDRFYLRLYTTRVDIWDSYGIGYPYPEMRPRLHVKIHELDQPFEETSYIQAPGPVPAYVSDVLVEYDSADDAGFCEIRIPLPMEALDRWVQDDRQVGLIVRSGEDISALIGLASDNLNHAGVLGSYVSIQTNPGPTICIEGDYIDRVYLPCQMDTSTFDQLTTVPDQSTDLMSVRTGIRHYPAFRFVVPELPANARVYSVGLRVTADSTGWGPLTVLSTSVVRESLFEQPDQNLSLEQLAAATHLTSRSGTRLAPRPGVQYFSLSVDHFFTWERQVSSGDRLDVVVMGQEYFSMPLGESPNSVYDGGLLMRQYNIYGPSAAEDLQPRLILWYGLK